MAGGGALVAALPDVAEAVTTGPVTLDEFMELCEALTDNEFSLRDEVGAHYLAALDPAAIKKLVQATVRAGDPTDVHRDSHLRCPQRFDQNAAPPNRSSSLVLRAGRGPYR